MNSTPWGVLAGLMEAMTSGGTSTCRTFSGSGSGHGSTDTTVCTSAPHWAASRSSLGLSHRHCPVWRR